MSKYLKTFYLATVVLLALILPFLLLNPDSEKSYFLPAACLSFIILLVAALINFKNLFLFLLIILPTVYHFNDYKINISPFDRYPIDLNPISVIYLFLIFIGLTLLLDNLRKLKNIPLKNVILLALAAGAASLFWSIDKGISVIELIYLAIPFVFYFLAFLFFPTPADYVKIFRAALLSSLGPVIISFYHLAIGQFFYEPDSSLPRLAGTMQHPNSLGLYLVVIIGLAFAFFLAKKDRSFPANWLLASYSGLLVLIFILTYSRTSWFCLALFFLIFCFFEKKLAVIFAALSPVYILIFLAVEKIRARILEIFDTAIFSSVTARKNIWKVSLDKIWEKPFWGHGIGTAEQVIENAKTWKGGVSLPHNDYFLHLLEMGLIGLIVYLGYTLGSLYAAIRKYLITPARSFFRPAEGNDLQIDLKILSFGLIALLIALLPATFFESISQKILIQIIIWSLLGSFLALPLQKAD